ncbi:MAG TPA: ribosome-associated translation inhibitor RaiA [Candidatus Nanopelagicales bacterium]|jgi:ribosomal subunit interface protein|nr:ribosome-associated translation inhibitor RaiA [Candidatus Nanopelagicales bacterium]
MNSAPDIVVRGRHFDLSQRFRDHVGEKLERVDRFGVGLSRIDVEISKQNNPRLADRAFEVELTCVGRGPVIRAEAHADDKYAALDVAYGRLEERLRRAADRRVDRHRRGASLATQPGSTLDGLTDDVDGAVSTEEPDVVYEDGPVVVREKTHSSTPMSVADALHAMELVGHDFFLFHDIESGVATVVYKRRGYDYGLLRLDLAG